MILLAILVLGASWWLVRAVNAPDNRAALERNHNARVLAQAKQALLGYVATEAADSSELYPGRLPCPEHPWYIGNPDKEGIQGPSIGVSSPGWGSSDCSMVGRLPWRTLGIDKLRDASGEPLWYAVTIGSNGWAYENTNISHPHPRLSINANKPGGLIVNGTQVVAAIIAPGRPISVNPTGAQIAAGCAAHLQDRTTNGPNYYQEFLECHNFSAGTLVTEVVDNATQPVFNDQLVTITAAEVMTEIEGIVAKRIESSVVPQLKAVYASANWNASAAAPVFPYAARFQSGGTFDPDSYKGSFGNPQGLLPMTAQTCNALTAGRCDTSYVQWNVFSVSAVQTGGTATSFSADCSTSTVTQIRCTVSYSQLLCLLSCGVSANVRVRADAVNVGNTLKVLNGSAATAVPNGTAAANGFALTALLRTDPNASARVTYTGTFAGGNGLGFCGGLLGVLCSGSGVITIPIGVFQDHPLVNPTSSDAWYWFTANKWYDVTYYAVAPSHLPSGTTHDCGTMGDCLAISGGNPSANVTSLLVLAGRSLANASRPNASLSDFLEDPTNYDGDGSFTQGALRRTYNDRFVSINNY